MGCRSWSFLLKCLFLVFICLYLCALPSCPFQGEAAAHLSWHLDAVPRDDDVHAWRPEVTPTGRLIDWDFINDASEWEVVPYEICHLSCGFVILPQILLPLCDNPPRSFPPHPSTTPTNTHHCTSPWEHVAKTHNKCLVGEIRP